MSKFLANLGTGAWHIILIAGGTVVSALANYYVSGGSFTDTNAMKAAVVGALAGLVAAQFKKLQTQNNAQQSQLDKHEEQLNPSAK